MTWVGGLVDVLAAVALLSGGLLAVVAGLGLLRFPDVLARLQSATKPQVLGLLLVCLGVAPFLHGPQAVALVLVGLFQLVTAPVLAQLVGRAAYRRGQASQAVVLDELHRTRE